MLTCCPVFLLFELSSQRSARTATAINTIISPILKLETFIPRIIGTPGWENPHYGQFFRPFKGF
jgi:hypothetical protein